jgi:hypothetical protein
MSSNTIFAGIIFKIKSLTDELSDNIYEYIDEFYDKYGVDIFIGENIVGINEIQPSKITPIINELKKIGVIFTEERKWIKFIWYNGADNPISISSWDNLDKEISEY